MIFYYLQAIDIESCNLHVSPIFPAFRRGVSNRQRGAGDAMFDDVASGKCNGSLVPNGERAPIPFLLDEKAEGAILGGIDSPYEEMSMNALIRPVALLFLGTALWAACGGDSSGNGDDPVALCKQGCDKSISLCFPDAGDAIKSMCEQSCTSNDGGTSNCTNASDRSAAAKACLDKTTCADLETCSQNIPPCAGGGTGGAGGAGATGGSGGSGATGGSTGGTGGGGTGGGGTGGADGGTATCADVLACCNAATTDQLKTACMMAYMAAMSSEAACAAIYPALKTSVCP